MAKKKLQILHHMFWPDTPEEGRIAGELFLNISREVTLKAKKKAVEVSKNYCVHPENLLKDWEEFWEEEFLIDQDDVDAVNRMRSEAQAKFPADWSEICINGSILWRQFLLIVDSGNLAEAKKFLRAGQAEIIRTRTELQQKLDSSRGK